ncbi:hypothetical protein KCU73_g6963, partial [Aureobasidium melanogenum]
SNSAMDDLVRLASMQARTSTDDTGHDTMHVNASALDEPMGDTSPTRTTPYKLVGYDDGSDSNNKPCMGNERDSLVDQSGAIEFTDTEIHTESAPDSSNSNTLDVSNQLVNSAQTLDVESIDAVYKDPVLMMMFRELDDHVLLKNSRTKLVARYIKLTLAKFAVIRDVKESEIEFPELMLAMQVLELDTESVTITEEDGPAQQVVKAGRALRASYSKVCKDATRKLKQLIRDSGVQVPKVYNENKEDDLCGVWYAIKSDRYYQGNEILTPCYRYEFRVLVVTYLHLVGGFPSHYTTLKKPKHTSYQQFSDLLLDFLSFSSLGDLDPECWTDLSEAEYEHIKGGSSQMVFLIHAADQAIPFGIVTKAQSHPRDWSTGVGSVTRTTTREGPVDLPPPNFLPSTLSDSMTALMSPAPQPAPTTAGPPAELSLPSHPASKRSRSDNGQQGSKRARVKR